MKKWKIQEEGPAKFLMYGDDKWDLEVKNDVKHLTASYPLLIGLGSLEIFGSLGVSSEEGAPLKLFASAEATLTVKIKPLIPLDKPDKDREVKTWVAWALEPSSDGTSWGGLHLTATLNAGFECQLVDDMDLLQSLFANANTKWFSRSFKCPTFDFPLRRLSGSVTEGLGALVVTPGDMSIDHGNLCFSNTKLKFDLLKNSELTLSRLCLDLKTFKVDVGQLIATLDNDATVFNNDDAPFTLILYKNSKFSLAPRLVAPELTIQPSGSLPALSAIVPGCLNVQEILKGANPDRLIFDLYGLENQATNSFNSLGIGTRGLSGEAKLRVTRLDIKGLDDCRLTEGKLLFRDGLFDGQVTATAKLPYFSNSEGSLSVRTGSDHQFSATWLMAVGKTWTDPTGNFEVHEPRAGVSIAFNKGKWDVDGKVGGQLHFVGISRLEGAAREWLSGFADALRLEFTELDIKKLVELQIGSIHLSLNLLRLPGPLDLWNILKLNLDNLALQKDGFSLGGKVSFGAGSGFAFEGRLPKLRCRFDKGAISISEDLGDDVNFSGKLTTPGGVSLSLDIQRERTDRVDELVGAGSLTIPSMPAIAVTCVLGQRTTKSGRHDPVFLLFARSDYPLPLFPGVVLRDIGIGMGISKVLKVVENTPHDQLVSQIVKGPTGWPDPGQPASWITPDRESFDLSLIADTYIAPSQQGRGTFPYVGAATLYARPTNDFLILLGANLWLMTSLDDARKSEFRKAPAAIGAMALFPRHGYLEVQVRTLQNSRMSEPVALIEQGLKMATGELYLRATRDEFLFRVGPLRSETTLGGVRLAGQIVFATYVGNRGALAVVQGSLAGQARYADQVSLRFGPLSVTAGFRFEANIAFETVMAGMVVPHLGMALYQRARVYAAVSLVVWVEIAFRLVIKFWRFRKTISWSTSHSASLTLSVDLWLEILVSKQPALYGKARVNVRLFGYSFGPSLEVGKSDENLRLAQKSLGNLLQVKN